jgi:hypothetical protein
MKKNLFISKIWMALIMSLALWGTSSQAFSQTVATNLANNNGSSVVVFSFVNTTADAVIITEIGSVASATSTQTAHLYSRAVAYNAPTGAPPALTSANGWSVVGTNNNLATIASAGSNVPSQFITGMNFIVPGLTQVQFALQLATGANQPEFTTTAGSLNYSTVGVQTCTFNTGGIELRVCDGYGYGGTAGAPTISPRGFIGYINFVPATACSGTPNLGATTGPASICPNINFNLGFSGSFPGTGTTYVWETSTNGVDFTPAAGAPNSPSWTTSITTNTWFRVTATCTQPGGGTASSTPIQVNVNPFSACYCVAGVGPTSLIDSNILGVTLNGESGTSINNATPCPATAGVMNFTSQSVTLMQGLTYNLDVLMGQCGTGTYNNVLKAWIDYNQDGVFNPATEELGVVSQGTSAAGVNGTLSFTVPFTATNGSTVIRVMMYETTNAALVLPCASFSWGSVHDYTINIISNTACSGTPAPGNTLSTLPSVCAGVNFTLSMQNPTAGSGVTYQWQTSTDGTNWNNAVGAPNASTWTTNQFAGTYYRCIVTCTASSETGTSTGLLVPMSSFISCYCTTNVGPTSNTYGNIENVNLTNGVQTLNNNTPCPANLGLQDFTTLTVVDLAQQDEYDLNLILNQCGVTSTWTNTVKAWIDYDQTGSFEPTEEIGVLTLPVPATGVPVTFSFTVPGTATLGQTRIRIMSIETPTASVVQPCASFTWGAAHDYIVNITPPVSCPKPNNLAATNVSSDAALISWVANPDQTTWEIQYGAPGFVAGQGTSVITNNNPHNLTGLTENTTYQVYVRSICAPGDTSLWRGPVTFTTLCNIFVAPMFENFNGSNWVSGNDFNNIGSQIDGCWDRNPEVATAFHWGPRSFATPDAATGPAFDKSGTGKYVYTEASVGTVGAIATFTSPAISLTEIVDPYLGFSYFMRGNNIDNLNVLVSNDFGTTWNNLLTITGQQQISVNDPWLDTIVSLAGFENDTVMIRFENTRTGINDDVAIDDFFILPCVGNPGQGGELNACSLGGQLDLSSVSQIAQTGGQWIFHPNPSAVVNNSTLNLSALPYSTHTVYYKVPGACQDDSLAVVVTVYPPSSAGTSSTLTNCNNGIINLFDGLTGTIDLGGQWYSPAGVPLNSAMVQVNGQLAGAYNYYYVTSNGICPADTSYAEVTLLNCVGLTENEIAGFELYPNPTADVVFLSYSGENMNAQVYLVDAKGSVISVEDRLFETNTVFEIKMSDLQAGVYFVTIVSETGRNIIQVVKQ